MSIHKILILFLISLSHLQAVLTYILEINPHKYFHCRVIVVRDPQQVNPQTNIIPEQVMYPHINRVIELNQVSNMNDKSAILTWVIKDSEYLFQNLPDLFKSDGVRNRNINYAVERNLQYKSCTIFITDPYQVFYGTKTPSEWNTEKKFSSIWGYWLTYISGFGKLPLTKLENTVLFTVTGFNPNVFSTWEHHEALFLAPFVVIFAQIVNNQTATNFQKFWWACHFCKVEWQLYHKMDIFTGNLNKSIIRSYGKTNEFHRTTTFFPFTTETFSRPLLDITIYDPNPNPNGKTGLDHRISCDVSSSYLFRHEYLMQFSQTFYFDFKRVKGCHRSVVTTINIISNKLNFSAIYGGLISLKTRNIYFTGVLQKTALTSNLLADFNPASDYLSLWDIRKYGIYYCEEKYLPVVSSFFTIIKRPFDDSTWISLTFSLIFLTICFRYTSIETKSLIDSLFEVFVLIFSRWFNPKYNVRILFLISFFFVEICFVSLATEKLIAPGKPYIMKTLSELFKNGYKIYQEPLNRHIPLDLSVQEKNNRISLGEHLVFDLKSEGFKENLLGKSYNKYWWPPIRKRLSEVRNYTINGYRNEIKTAFTYQMLNYKMYPKCTIMSLVKCHLEHCFRIPKKYGYVFDIIHIYSKVKNQIKSILDRILYDGGLRLLWMKMENEFENRLFHLGLKVPEKAIKISITDPRLLALFQLAALCLSLSFVQFIFEMRTMRLCIRKVLNSWKILMHQLVVVGLLRYYFCKLRLQKSFCDGVNI